jgi:uncharacterized protein (TIGR02996 family)
MSDEQALLAAIVENPDDDLPRLIYADFIQEQGQSDRAEFIRLQCQLAQLNEDDPNREKLENREQRLLKRHQESWLKPFEGCCTKSKFSRGFVEEMTLSSSQFLFYHKWIFSRTPLRGCRFHKNPVPASMRELARCPALEKLSSLVVAWFIGEDGWRDLLRSPYLPKVNKLWSIESGLDGTGLRGIASSPKMAELRSITLHNDEAGIEGIRSIVYSPTIAKLEHLHLHNSVSLRDFGAFFAEASWLSHLRTLVFYWCDLTDRSLISVLQSKQLNQLRTLSLTGNQLLSTESIITLVNTPELNNLRQLALDGISLNRESVRAIAESPYLRELKKLSLKACAIEDIDLQLLLESSNLRKVQHLELAGNARMGDDLASSIIHCPYLSNLQYLDVTFNLFTSEARKRLLAHFGNQVAIKY